MDYSVQIKELAFKAKTLRKDADARLASAASSRVVAASHLKVAEEVEAEVLAIIESANTYEQAAECLKNLKD